MKYGLSLDISAVEFLHDLSKPLQRRLYQRLREIQARPDAFSDFTEYDGIGRRVDVHLFAGCAISYWDDFADRHVRVLQIEPAGR